ncbi:alpha/beta hydrolase [Longispora albida]|uniref:alpha/beta hydrolase n=1 Tax=Longispora albida TaxID=203523 RepID=UPI0003A2260B|nr:alpha/beta hydrolase [Longispora albida]
MQIASLVAVGATFVSALAPATAADADARDPLRRYAQQQPHWQRCAPDRPAALQCTTLKAPLDYTDPGGRTIDLAVSRLKASSATHRRGVLLLNPGGPGAPGLDLPADPALTLSEEVKRRYDLIGFDPRGVGRSSPVSCGLTGDEQELEWPYHAETFAADVRRARTVAEKCRARAGDTLRHLTTRNTARDLDVIRAVLGEKKISYLGFSYGTYLGAVYTQLFPQRADRFVLDSAADPTRYSRGMLQAMAERAEPVFTRWTEWTAQRHATYQLGATPAEVRRTFWQLVTQADRSPITVGGAPLTGDAIRAQYTAFARVRDAATWVAELKRAAEGRSPSGAPAPGAPAPSGPAADVPADNNAASAWAVLCADNHAAWPRDPEQYRRDAIRDRARFPLAGDFGSTIKPCAFWQRGSEPATAVGNTVRALIVQNEWDSSTPLASGQAMHRALRGSRLVTVAGGEGHIVNGTNACADQAAMSYLVAGRLPAQDLTCRA